MRKVHSKENSLAIAFIFICSIVLLLLGGLLLKLFLVLRASTFDGVHQYIVEVDESLQKGALVAFNPSNKTVTVLTITGKVDSTFGKYLQVPVDASVSMPLPEDSSKIVEQMIFSGKNEKNITVVDEVRLMLFVNSLKQSDFNKQSLTLPVDQTVTEKLLPSLFVDNTLYFDNESVSIVNATGESGVGSEVAHMMGLIGINVLSVTTADEDSDKTTLTGVHTDTYTMKRIERLFHTTATTNTNNVISDITLTIGKDALPSL